MHRYTSLVRHCVQARVACKYVLHLPSTMRSLKEINTKWQIALAWELLSARFMNDKTALAKKINLLYRNAVIILDQATYEISLVTNYLESIEIFKLFLT